MNKKMAAIALALGLMSVLTACNSRDGFLMPEAAPTATSVPAATRSPAATAVPKASATPKATNLPEAEDGMITDDNGTYADKQNASGNKTDRDEGVLGQAEQDLKDAGNDLVGNENKNG